MRRKIYLRFTLILSLFVLLAMASIGGQPRAAAPDVCSEACIHDCKVAFEACLAEGNSETQCKLKFEICLQRCNCAD